MNVVLINGSPRKQTCHYALTVIAEALESQDIETEIVNIGTKPVRGCTACEICHQKGMMRCVFDDDITNSIIKKCIAADGIIVGSPVYYAGMNGALKSIMDRMFYSAGAALMYKPACGIASVRRGGSTNAIDQINKYFEEYSLPVVTSRYWPMVYGTTAEEGAQDREGVQVMHQLGLNMAWLLKCIKAGKDAGIEPIDEPRVFMNFIR